MTAQGESQAGRDALSAAVGLLTAYHERDAEALGALLHAAVEEYGTSLLVVALTGLADQMLHDIAALRMRTPTSHLRMLATAAASVHGR